MDEHEKYDEERKRQNLYKTKSVLRKVSLGICSKCTQKAYTKWYCLKHTQKNNKRRRRSYYMEKEENFKRIKKEIVLKIKKALIDSGMTQAQFSREIGVSGGLITHWINGRCCPSNRSLTNMEKVFNLKLTTEERKIITGGVSAKIAIINKRELKWEYRFDKYFTRKYDIANAEGYDGDEWRVIRGEPIKPSKIKEFIKSEFLKESEVN